MIPIGECNNGYITLMYGEDGAIYGGFDDCLWKYGEDMLSAIDIIINGKAAIEL